MPQRANRFWTIFLTIVFVDVATKRFAVNELSPPHVPHDVIGDFLRFTLAFNPGGAMSLSLGPSSRWWFTLLSIATLFVLAYIYRQTSPDARIQLASIALICGGAVGNLLDRVRFVEDDEVVREKISFLALLLFLRAAEEHEKEGVIDHDHVGREQPFARLLKETIRTLAAGFTRADMGLAANLRPDFRIRFDREIAQRSVFCRERPVPDTRQLRRLRSREQFA